MNKQKNDGLGFLLLCVLCGIVLGAIMALISRLAGFSTDVFLAVILTIIAGILIGFCLFPLVSNFKNHLLWTKGVQMEGKITDVVNTIASPLYYRPGDDGKPAPICDLTCVPAMYVLRITYSVGGKTIEKEFPPTLERTAKQLLPYKMEKDAVLPVICLPQKPQWAAIAVPGLVEETFSTQKRAMRYGALVALLVFAFYLALLFNI